MSHSLYRNQDMENPRMCWNCADGVCARNKDREDSCEEWEKSIEKKFEWMMPHGCQTETFYYNLEKAEEIMRTAIEAGRPIPNIKLDDMVVGEFIKGDSMWASFKRIL